MNCKGLTKNGVACGAQAMDGSELCINHNPEAAEIKAAAVRKGGENSHPKMPTLEPVKVNTVSDVVVLLEQIINEVRTGQIDTRDANTIGYLSLNLLKAYEMSEVEKRLANVESTLSIAGILEEIDGKTRGLQPNASKSTDRVLL